MAYLGQLILAGSMTSHPRRGPAAGGVGCGVKIGGIFSTDFFGADGRSRLPGTAAGLDDRKVALAVSSTAGSMAASLAA